MVCISEDDGDDEEAKGNDDPGCVLTGDEMNIAPLAVFVKLGADVGVEGIEFEFEDIEVLVPTASFPGHARETTKSKRTSFILL